jgi:bla regulator protein blaR1
MERILFNISQVLGITIIHSLWQGLFVYFALRILLTFKISASQKHLLAMLGLFTITGWFFYTLFNEIAIYNQDVLKPGNLSAMPLMLGIPAGITHLSTQATRYYYSIERYLPYISIAYAAGLVYNSAVLLIARKKINTIRQTMCVDDALQEKVKWFMATLHIGKNVKVGLSHLVDVPCIAGFIKPVIMLPVTLSTTLSAEEIESILLHELAHIKRNDYLVNLAQQTMRVLLFFNPFAQLTVSIINREREISCDDIVVVTSQNPMAYAQALIKLEEARRNQGQLALTATGKRYHLLNRIENIMKPKKNVTNTRHVLLTVVLFTIGIISVAWLNPTVANGKISVRNVKPIIEKAFSATGIVADTTTKKTDKKVTVKKDEIAAVANQQADTADAYRNDPITNGYQLMGFDDPKQDAILTMLKKYSDAVSGVSKTDEYKRLHDNLDAAQKNLKDYRNDVLYDHIYTEERKASNDFYLRWGGDDGRNEHLGDEIKTLGSKVGKYYGSDDFKKLNARLQKKYSIDPDKKYADDDQSYHAYQAELNSNIPADIKDATDLIKKDGLTMHQQLNSPEYKADLKHLMTLIDSMNHFRSPETEKKYQDAVTEAANQSFAYYKQHEAEEKRNLDSLKIYGEKLHAYNQSAEYRQHVKAWRDQLKTALGSDYEKIEHPDRPDTAGTK